MKKEIGKDLIILMLALCVGAVVDVRTGGRGAINPLATIATLVSVISMVTAVIMGIIDIGKALNNSLKRNIKGE